MISLLAIKKTDVEEAGQRQSPSYLISSRRPEARGQSLSGQGLGQAKEIRTLRAHLLGKETC